MRIYVSTFAKYNSGSLRGEWLELEGYDKESFFEACRELHADESDPEYMYQDFEGFPASLFSESYLSEELFELANMPEDEREIVLAYAETMGCDVSDALESAQDALCAEWDSETDFAQALAEDTGDLKNVPLFIQHCIDWQAVWDSTLRFDYIKSDSRNSRGNFYFFVNQ